MTALAQNWAGLVAELPWLWPLVATVLGLMVGSFINVVAHRLPIMLQAEWRAECQALLAAEGLAVTLPETEPCNLAVPASRCPTCRQPIRPWHNLPLLGYALLRGRCHHCRQPIGLRYPLVELAGGLLAAVVAWQLGWTAQAGAALVFGWTLLALMVIDLDHQLLPDRLTLPLLWLGLLANATGLWVPLADAVWGAVAGYSLLWSVFWLFKWATGKEGLGYGDFKLLAALGAWLGWQQLALVVVLSSVAGALTGVALIALQRHDRGTPLPFGPFLATAGWVALLWGEPLVQSYLQFTGW